MAPQWDISIIYSSFILHLGATVVNEQLYIFGGVGRDRNPMDTVQIYDFKKNVLSVYPSNFNGIGQNIITINKQLMIIKS